MKIIHALSLGLGLSLSSACVFAAASVTPADLLSGKGGARRDEARSGDSYDTWDLGPIPGQPGRHQYATAIHAPRTTPGVVLPGRLGEAPLVWVLADGRRIEWSFQLAAPLAISEQPAENGSKPETRSPFAVVPGAVRFRNWGHVQELALPLEGARVATSLRLDAGLSAALENGGHEGRANRLRILDERGAAVLVIDGSGAALSLEPGDAGRYALTLQPPGGDSAVPGLIISIFQTGSWGGYQCNRANASGPLPGTASNGNPYGSIYVGEYYHFSGETSYHCDGYMLFDLSSLPPAATLSEVQLYPFKVATFTGAGQNVTVRDVDNGRTLAATAGYGVDVNYYNDFRTTYSGNPAYAVQLVNAVGTINLPLNSQAVMDAMNRLRSTQNYFAVAFDGSATGAAPGNFMTLDSGTSQLFIYYADYTPNQVVISYVNPSVTTDSLWLYNYGEAVDLSGWQLQSINWVPSTQTFTLPAFTLGRHQGVKIVDSAGTNNATTIYTGGGVFTWAALSINPYHVRLSLLRSAAGGGGSADYLCFGNTNPAPPAGAAWNGGCVASAISNGGNYYRMRDSDTDGPGDWANDFSTALPGQALQPGMAGVRRRSDVFINHFMTFNSAYSWISIVNYGPPINLQGWTLSFYSASLPPPVPPGGVQQYGVYDGQYVFPSTPLATGDVVWLGSCANTFPGYHAIDTWHQNMGDINGTGNCAINWYNAPVGGEIILQDESAQGRDYAVFGEVHTMHVPHELNWNGGYIGVTGATPDVIRNSDLDTLSAAGWLQQSGLSNWGALGPNARGALRAQDESGTSRLPNSGYYSYAAAGFGAGTYFTVTRQVGLEEFAAQAAPVNGPLSGQLVIKKLGAASIYYSVPVTVGDVGQTMVSTGLISPPLVLDPGTYGAMLYLNGNWYDAEIFNASDRLSFGTIGGVTVETGTTPTTALPLTYSNWGFHGYFSTISPPAITSPTPLPTAVRGIAYSFNHTSSGGYGAARTWTITAGALPAGLTMSAAGVVSGTPTVDGIFDFTVQVMDGAGLFSTQVEQLTVNVPLGIATNALPVYDGANAPYSYALQPLGGLAPYSWAITSGALPGGLTLSSAGVISGTAGAGVGNGTYNVTYRVSDGNGQVATKLLGLTVYRTPVILTLQLAAGYVGMGYGTQRLEGMGGSGASTWAVFSGGLPPGLTLGNDTTGGYITGTPTLAGTFPVTLSYSNGGGTATRAYSVQVLAASAVPPYWIRRGLTGGSVQQLYFSPNFASDGTVAAIAGGSLYISSDFGYFWRPMNLHGHKVLDPATGKYNSDVFFNVEFHPNFDGTPGGANHTIVVSASQTGLWRSTDLDQTWASLGFTCSSVFHFKPGGVGGTGYCVAWNPALGTHVMYRTTGGLLNWVPIGAQGLHDWFISPTFATDNTMFAYDSGDPTDPTRYYLYRSTDGGFHWVLMQNLGPKWALEDVQFSPNYASDQTILFTFPNFIGTIGELIKISHDGGQSITTLGAFSGVDNLTFAPDYDIASNRKIYATQTDYYDTQGGNGGAMLVVSTDDGLSFKPTGTGGLPPPQFAGMFQLSPNFLTDNLIFVFGSAGLGMARSMDGGATWGPSDSGLYVQPIKAAAFAPNYSGGNGKSFVSTERGIYYSSNGGKVWKPATLPAAANPWYVTSLRVSPNFATDATVYAAAYGSAARLLRSTDGGLTFADFAALPDILFYTDSLQISPNFSADHAIFMSPVFDNAASRFRFDKSADFGTTFNPQDIATIGSAGRYAVSPSIAADGTIYLDDYNGGVRRGMISTNGGVNFSLFAAAPAGDDPPALAPNYNRTAALSGSNHTMLWNCRKSIDNGASFSNLGVYACGRPIFSPAFSGDQTFFNYHDDYTGATNSGLYKFTSGGAAFTQVSPAGDPTAFDSVNDYALSPAYGSDQTLMVATDAGLYISNDGGSTFALSSGTEAFSRQITAVAQDPNTAGRLYIGSADLGIVRSDDDGISSVPINTGLPAGPVNALIAVGSPSTFVLAAVNSGTPSTTGIYYSNNLGATWSLRALCDGRKFELQGAALFAACADRPSWTSNNNGLTWTALGSQVSDGSAITYSANNGPTFLTGAKPNPKLPAGNQASLWSASGGIGAYYSTNSGASWTAALGSNDYTLPAASGWTTVQPLGVNAASAAREVLIGHNTQGLFRSADGGVTWRNVSGAGSGLEATSKNVSTLLTATTPYGTTDVLVGINGSTTGGVYQSGDGGEHWQQINQGFDPNSLNISTLVKTSCSGCPVQYYSGTYGSGVYTRTILVNPQPVVTGWCFGSIGCACNNINPLTGPEQGGQAFKLCGGNFLALPTVEFDGVAATGCAMGGSGTYVTCTATPPHVPGTAVLRERNTDTRPGYPKDGGGIVMPYIYIGGAARVSNLHVAKSGSDALLTWTCASCGAPPAKVYRAESPQMSLFLESYTGGAGTYTNTGALAPAANPSYFWNVE